MKKQTKEQNNQLVAIMLIMLAILVGVYVTQQKTNLLPKAASPATMYDSKQIETAADLNRALFDLDYANIDQFDQEVNQNMMDASSF